MVRNTIDGMIKKGFCEKEVQHLLINCVLAGMNFVFAGEPAVGKTECAKFFMQFVPADERVITIEDSLELHYGEINPGSDFVELQVNKGFDYTDAIKACLRQDPNWLVLSEARSREVASLLEQWSTGVNGFTTIHLNDVRKLPDRIQNMMSDERDAELVVNQVYSYVNVCVLIRMCKNPDGSIYRYIDQCCFFNRDAGKNHIYMLVENGKLVSKELPEDIEKKFRYAGIKEPFYCERMEEFKQWGK